MRQVHILWLRQMRKYFRSKSRIVGAVGQPLLFLLALGYGIGSIFKQAGQGDYIQFLVPGVIIQTILFGSIFWGINIIFDRLWGFLKETMVAPVSRLKIFLGSVLGGATTAVLQAVLVLVISLFMGFRPYSISMLLIALAVVCLFAVAVTSLGAGLGSMMDNIQGFQAINQFLIFPLYFLSSSLYPLDHAPKALRVIGNLNPISYAVDALRTSLIGQTHFGLLKDFIVLAVTIVILVAFGVNRFRRIEV